MERILIGILPEKVGTRAQIKGLFKNLYEVKRV
jgi:hypothetical protein